MKRLQSLKMRWVTWVWNHTPNCAEMSRLASLALERPPSLSMRLRMRLHHLICAWCRRYEKQLRFLHRAAPHLDKADHDKPAVRLSNDAKRRLIERLNGQDPRT